MAVKELDRLKTMRPERNIIEHKARSKERTNKFEFKQIKVGSLDERLFQAGIVVPKSIFLLVTTAISLFAGYIGFFLGAILGVFAFGATEFYCLTIYLDERAAKRRNKVLPHLPGFIDGLASALGTGFNLEAAVIQATESVPLGILRAELDRVVSGIKSGLPLDQAMLTLKRRVAGKEVLALGVSVVLFHDLGGRMLEPFRRLAEKVREQQTVVSKANRDLVQVRLAFNIILFLSVVAPAALMAVKPDYLYLALSDSFGRLLIQIAVIMQLVALLFFKRTMTFRV